MFCVIFIYCWLMSFAMSAPSNNDTFHNESNSSMSNNTFKFPVVEDCVLDMKWSEVMQIIQFMKNDAVNIVDFELIYVNIHKVRDSTFTQFSLVTLVGREIVHLLHEMFFGIKLTLNAGRRNLKLHINETGKGCFNVMDMDEFIVGEIFQQIFLVAKQPISHEICYLGERDLNRPYLCCQITEYDFIGSLKFQCLETNAFLRTTFYSTIFTAITFVILPIYYLKLLFHLLSYSLFDIRYSKYYKLEESTMSLSSIALRRLWKQPEMTFARHFRAVPLVCIFLSIVYSLIFFLHSYSLMLLAMCFLLLLLFARVTPNDISHGPITSIPKIGNFFIHQMVSWMGYSEQILRQKDESEEFEDVIALLTLPFNRKHWRKHLRKQRRELMMNGFGFFRFWILICLICVFYVPLCLCWSIILLYLYLIYKIVALSIALFLDINSCFFHAVGVCIMLVGGTLFCYVSILALQYFLLGVFLNLIYFIPYLASFSVLTFHCYSYWKSVEEKYFVLKQLIYEECRDIQRVSNGYIPNRHPKPKENVLPVVSRELYDKVREELLPYHTNLFYFSLKLLMLSIFAYCIFELVNTLHALKISAVVQVLITVSVSIVPYIFNMEKLNTSEARKKAWLEKMKLNVKYIVEELTLEDPELARTVLIIQDKSNGTVDREQETAYENVLQYESSV